MPKKLNYKWDADKSRARQQICNWVNLELGPYLTNKKALILDPQLAETNLLLEYGFKHENIYIVEKDPIMYRVLLQETHSDTKLNIIRGTFEEELSKNQYDFISADMQCACCNEVVINKLAYGLSRQKGLERKVFYFGTSKRSNFAGSRYPADISERTKYLFNQQLKRDGYQLNIISHVDYGYSRVAKNGRGNPTRIVGIICNFKRLPNVNIHPPNHMVHSLFPTDLRPIKKGD